MDKKSQSSILDPFQDTLQPCMWEKDEGDNYLLKDEVRQEILDGVKEIENYTDLNARAITLYGGAASYQYSSASDIDISVYVSETDEYKENYEEYAKLFKSYMRETCGLEVHYFLKPPHLNETVKEASESVYDVLNNEWIVKPVKHDFDPKVEWKEKVDQAMLLDQEVSEQLEQLKSRLEQLKYEQRSYCDISDVLDKFVAVYDTMREKRDEDHKKLLELEYVTVQDRATQSEINWKYLDFTGTKDKLSYLKKINKLCSIDK